MDSRSRPAAPRRGLRHFARWIAWQAKFTWNAMCGMSFEDERVQRLVRQHFEEFYRG